jgi:hypothetical protein
LEQHHRVTTMKHALPIEIVNTLPSYHARQGGTRSRGSAQASARIQGGNWSMLGMRRSSHVYDEDECQMSIAEFMAGQERLESAD